MGMLNEYLDMAGRGLKNLNNVAQGNFNRLKDALGVLPEDEKQEAERRYAICMNCPFMSENAKKNGFYNTQRLDNHCSLCKCPIESKVMAMNDGCGLSMLEENIDGNGTMIGGVVGFHPLWGPYIKNT